MSRNRMGFAAHALSRSILINALVLTEPLLATSPLPVTYRADD